MAKTGIVLSDLAGEVLYNIYKKGIRTERDLREVIHADVESELNELLEKGLIKKQDDEYFEEPRSLFTVGVSILNDYTYINLCSFSEIISEKKIETSAMGTREIFLQSLENEIIAISQKNEHAVVGVGILVVGGVDELLGISRNSYGLLSPNCQIAKDVEKTTLYMTRMGHNVRAVCSCLINKDLQNFVYMKHSPGVGAAVCIDGKIITGAHSGFAEIGHIPFSPITNDSPRCRCGRPGCLETEVSDAVLLEKYKALSGHECANTQVLYTHYKTDSKAKQVVDEAIDKIVLALNTMNMLFDPEHIILNGGLFDEPGFIDIIQEKYTHTFEPIAAKVEHLDSVEEKKKIAPATMILDYVLLNSNAQEETDE